MNLGRMNKYVILENPTQVADGDGGYVETWVALNPREAHVDIHAAPGRTGERRIANTTVAQGTHEVIMRFHPQVTTRTRISWTDRAGTVRRINVVDVNDLDEMGVELRLTCVEVIN
jgi:head-tail adaptor